MGNYEGTCNGYTWRLLSTPAGWVAICDGWYRTEAQPTMKLARHAARIWLSYYGG